MEHHKNKHKSVKSPRPVMRTATWLNVGYGLLEAYIGGVSGSSAALANGVHNAADGVSHAMHTATHIEEHSDTPKAHKIQNRRKIAAGAIAVGALLTGGNAVHSIFYHEQEPLNVQALAAELGAVVINAGLIIAIRRRNDGTIAYSDALRHHAVDGAIATGTAASIVINPYLPYADGLGGLGATIASGYLVYSLWRNDSH